MTINQYTILIVDDDKTTLKLITHAIKNDNYLILTALNGNEALLKLKNHKVDLIIADQMMPGMTGVELLKKVQIDYPDVLTIMLTAYGDIDTAMNAINEAGVYKFILKPWDNYDLKVTVQRILELRQVIMERNYLRDKVKKQEAILSNLGKKHPGLTKVERDEQGTTILEI